MPNKFVSEKCFRVCRRINPLPPTKLSNHSKRANERPTSRKNDYHVKCLGEVFHVVREINVVNNLIASVFKYLHYEAQSPLSMFIVFNHSSSSFCRTTHFVQVTQNLYTVHLIIALTCVVFLSF